MNGSPSDLAQDVARVIRKGGVVALAATLPFDAVAFGSLSLDLSGHLDAGVLLAILDVPFLGAAALTGFALATGREAPRVRDLLGLDLVSVERTAFFSILPAISYFSLLVVENIMLQPPIAVAVDTWSWLTIASLVAVFYCAARCSQLVCIVRLVEGPEADLGPTLRQMPRLLVAGLVPFGIAAAASAPRTIGADLVAAWLAPTSAALLHYVRAGLAILVASYLDAAITATVYRSPRG